MTETESPSISKTKDAAKEQENIESLKVSELRYRRLFEAARDGILILDSKLGRITDANPFMSELLSYTREELLGKELWEIGLLQDKEANKEAFRQLEREGYIRYENLPLLNQRGEKREVEIVSNLYPENGHTVIQCNIRDITERKRVEEDLSLAANRHAHQTAILEERARLANKSPSISKTKGTTRGLENIESLKVSELRYRRLFEAARDGILILDSKLGKITDSNPFMSELLSYTREELHGKELWEIGLLQDKEANKETFRQLERDGFIRYENLPLQNQHGEKREVEFVSNIYPENGHTVIQCNIRDITDRKRVEADLSLASIKHAHQTAILEERTRLAQEIHDTMAQGFTGITAQLDAAQASMLSDEEIDSHGDYINIRTKLDKVRSRILKARELARESLIETRLAVAALRSPPLDTTPLSEAIGRFLAKLMKGLPIKSRYVLEGLPQLLSEELEHCILRVGQESIANAIEHSDAKEIHVELLYEIGQVKLTVKDDGKGFNASHLGMGRFGIIGMRERADSVGGKLTITSTGKDGTQIELAVPIPPQHF